MFNLFGKKKEPASKGIFTDKVFISTEAKMNACAELARERPITLFVAWFPDTLSRFRQFFETRGIAPEILMEARQLHSSIVQKHTIVFVEHYPLNEKETSLVSGWEQEEILVYSALDEPLFKHFGSEKMIPLIRMLGMKENEAIEHPMVTQSINKGQQKIAGQVSLETSARSQEDWMRMNLA